MLNSSGGFCGIQMLGTLSSRTAETVMGLPLAMFNSPRTPFTKHSITTEGSETQSGKLTF